jgi:hypothetical protein
VLNNIVIDSINYIKIFMFVIDRRQLLKPEINWLIEKLYQDFLRIRVQSESRSHGGQISYFVIDVSKTDSYFQTWYLSMTFTYYLFIK